MRALAACVLLAACVEQPNALRRGKVAATASAAAEPCWPIVGLALNALEHGREWEPIVVLREDGAIFHLGSKSDVPVAKLADDVVATKKGRFACAQDRTLVLDGHASNAGFTPNDELVLRDDGTRIFVADDGTVSMWRRGKYVFGPPGSGGASARVEGPVKRARRTAALLVLVGIAGGR